MRRNNDWLNINCLKITENNQKSKEYRKKRMVEKTPQEACTGYYGETINSSPLLSKKEEMSLANLILNESGKVQQDAREKLFNANIRLVLKVAHFYSLRSSTPITDLTQSGMIGLAVAVDKFNPNKFKTRFSTYATSWIKLKIFHALNNDSPVYVPSNIADKSRQYKKMLDSDESGECIDLSNRQLMDVLQVSENGLRNIKAVNSSTLSLEAPLFKDSGSVTTVQEVLSDSKIMPISKHLEKEDTKKTLRIALGTLNPIQQEILTLRYLDDNEKNGLIKLGKRYNLTGERIRQIEYKALKKLRFRLKSKENFTV